VDETAERPLAVESIGERLAGLRLRGREAVTSMRRSLEQHGLLSPVAVFQTDDGVELIDGFKRLGAARALGWKEVRARSLEVDAVGAKLAIALLHEGVALSEMEEAWLVRSLYREDGLSQPAIGAHLGRHKSWVSRRLLLAEALDEAVQTDVRLGLLSPRAATELALLPRGNQRAAAQVVIRTGMTTRQTATLVGELLVRSSGAERALVIQDRLEHPAQRAAPHPARRARTAAEWILADVAIVRRAAGRLQGRLLGHPLDAFGPRVAEVTGHALRDLVPVLEALGRTIETSAGTGGVP
jgi:ParB-like chromosome segregation protein Spo0J